MNCPIANPEPAKPERGPEYWEEKARARFGNLPPHELREAVEYLRQSAHEGFSAMAA